MTAAPSDLLLPDDARLLHIGPQKTGSTALQAAIQENREALAALVLFREACQEERLTPQLASEIAKTLQRERRT